MLLSTPVLHVLLPGLALSPRFAVPQDDLADSSPWSSPPLRVSLVLSTEQVFSRRCVRTHRCLVFQYECWYVLQNQCGCKQQWLDNGRLKTPKEHSRPWFKKSIIEKHKPLSREREQPPIDKLLRTNIPSEKRPVR